jgi:hypothetical protein
MIDQRVLNAAVWDVNHTVRISLKQSEFGRTQATSDGEPRAVSKPVCWPGDYRYLWQTVIAR